MLIFLAPAFLGVIISPAYGPPSDYLSLGSLTRNKNKRAKQAPVIEAVIKALQAVIFLVTLNKTPIDKTSPITKPSPMKAAAFPNASLCTQSAGRGFAEDIDKTIWNSIRTISKNGKTLGDVYGIASTKHADMKNDKKRVRRRPIISNR